MINVNPSTVPPATSHSIENKSDKEVNLDKSKDNINRARSIIGESDSTKSKNEESFLYNAVKYIKSIPRRVLNFLRYTSEVFGIKKIQKKK